ncbi:hypothetical protein J7K99_03320 [bacterium]|nr:hypothetical protein [bacterium]
MKRWIYILVLVAVVIAFFGNFLTSKSNKFIFGTDYVDLGHFSVKFFHDYFHRFGRYPLWEPHLHGGMPFMEGMHGAIFFPLAVPLRLVLPPHRAWGYGYVLYMLIAGLSMFLLLRFYKLKDGAAFLGALTFMLSPVLVSFIYAGHDGRMSVIAILPFMVWLLERAMARRRLIDFLWFALGYAFYVLTVHLQMVYFASWLLGALFVFRLVRGIVKKEYSTGVGAKIFAMFVFALVLAVGMTTFQIYPPYYYLGHYSFRTQKTEGEKGIEFSNSWRMNLEDLVSAVYPDFVGVDLPERGTYWGRNVFRINSHYLGILAGILALAALFALREPLLKFLAGFSLFAITYALGTQTPLFYIYYYLIPGVKKFRGPEMLFFTVAFAVAVGMAFAVDAVLRSGEKKSGGKKSSPNPIGKYILWTALIITAGMLILTIVGKPLAAWWLKTAPNYAGVDIQHKLAALGRNFPIFLKSGWLATVLAWIGVGILLWRTKTQKLANYAVVLVVGIVLLVDLWRISKPFVKIDDINRYFSDSDLVETLKSRWSTEGPFRTFALPQTVSYAYLGSFGLDALTLSELHGNQLRWYDEFTGRHQARQNVVLYQSFRDILNVRYLVAPQQMNLPGHTFVGMTSKGYLYRSELGFPRARSFFRWETASHKGALARLKDPLFQTDSLTNYRTTLIVEGEPPFAMPQIPDSLAGGFTEGKILNNEYDRFDVRINMPYDGLLFVSTNWYPEWRATEDGEELPIYRADYSFMAVPLRRGEHTVHFEYEGELVRKSVRVSLIVGVVWIIVFAGTIILGRRKGNR